MIDNNKLISVVIPTYNNAEFLSDAVESVLSQTYPNLEIIVINDGSTDNTKEVVKNYDGIIVYIEQANAGPSKARNAGIIRARGEYVAFLDADDMWMPTKIEEQMKTFAENTDVALVYSRMVNFDNLTGNKLTVHPENIYSGNIFDVLLVKSIIPLPSIIVKTSIIRNIGCFDESLLTAEDTNLYLKIAHDHEIIGMDQVLVQRRRHGTNISDRVDINIGTLDSLDKIVALFPETNPKKYIPMKQAYIYRGNGLVQDCFFYKNYKKCHNESSRLLQRVGVSDIGILGYWLMTLLPAFILNFIRKIKGIEISGLKAG